MRVAAASLLCLVALSRAAAQDAPPPSRRVPAVPRPTTVPTTLPLKFVGPPTGGAITPIDLMTRLYKFADDSMMGREAGTPWNDKGTEYIASELKRLGLRPAGEDGTYFQNALEQRLLDSTSYIEIGGRRLTRWTEFAPRDRGDGAQTFDGAPVVFGGTVGDTASYASADETAGKIVLLRLAPGADGRVDYNVNRAQLTARFPTAAAVAVAQLDYAPPGYVEQAYMPPQIGERGVTGARPRPNWFYVTNAVATQMLGASLDSARRGMTGPAVHGRVAFVSSLAPGRNVLAILPGSDPALRGEYVVVGAHNDHVGFSRRPADHDSIKALMMHAAPQGADSPSPAPTAEQWVAIRATLDSLRRLHPSRADSIYNGADDDGSGSMSVLEIAERFATAPTRPKRSILFAFHVGEEKGLLGSAYFTDHPTVPRDSIVAELNIDMVGRGGAHDVTGERKEGGLIHGGPGYVQLIGARRLSTELGDLVEHTNASNRLGLTFDYALDANGHPQNIYCRSDHYMYARYGIPIAFFTTGGHADYHQVTDEPQYIDYRRMATIAQLVHATAVRAANLDHRLVVDKPKPDPRGTCQQ